MTKMRDFVREYKISEIELSAAVLNDFRNGLETHTPTNGGEQTPVTNILDLERLYKPLDKKERMFYFLSAHELHVLLKELEILEAYDKTYDKTDLETGFYLFGVYVVNADSQLIGGREKLRGIISEELKLKLNNYEFFKFDYDEYLNIKIEVIEVIEKLREQNHG